VGGGLFEMSERVIGVRIGEVIDAATGGRESERVAGVGVAEGRGGGWRRRLVQGHPA